MTRRILAIPALAFVVAGCTTYVVSPPAEYASGEVPGARAPGTRSVSLEASYLVEVFQPPVTGQALRLRSAHGHDLEVSASVFHALLLPEDVPEEYANLSRSIAGGRGGLKWGPLQWLAVTGGLGGGFSELGGYVSPEVGLAMGYANPYATPFAHVRVGGSFPFATRTLLLPESSDDGAPVVPFEARPTSIVGFTGGLRVILHRYRADQSHRLYLTAAFELVYVTDGHSGHHVWYGGASALELELGRGAAPRRAEDASPP